ncbi:MAG: acyl--CoA ligase [Candidatus Riflebacteria bacterium]|nr:acyl--CoA ligase [Candidatus Riflebacteria bacterium]
MASPIFSAFQKWVELTPHKTALSFNDLSFTYEMLSDSAQKLAAGMTDAGIKPGDHIGVVLPNCPEFIFLMLAAAQIGLAIVPHNSSMSAAALASAFAASDVKHLVGWHSVLADLKNATISPFNSKESVWISLGGSVDDCMNFSSMLTRNLPMQKQPDITGDQPYIFSLTSGSTGEPKPIVLLQSTKMARAHAAQTLYSITSNDVTLAATPLYHSLAERLVLLPLITGGTAVLMATFSAKDWLATVGRHNVSFSIAVSSQLKQILPEIRNQPNLANSLRCLVSSSALLDSRLKAELLSYLACDFHECYGTSEIAIASNLSRKNGESKLASVGNAAPGVVIKIIDENNNELAADQPGEIACNTPMRFAGYYKRNDLTRAAMLGDYFKTGDIGKIDKDGFLYFLGRKKDIIITGGVNVYPQDVENVIMQHPLICECAAIALPDEQLGEIVAVAIVTNDREKLNIRDLQRLSAKQLADYQQPRRYILLDELPKNRMGKVMKRELTEKYTSEKYDTQL